MNLEKIQKSDVLERLGLEKDKYILLSAHREENIDSEKNFLSLFTAINALAEKYDMPILYSCHPRSKHRLEKSGFKTLLAFGEIYQKQKKKKILNTPHLILYHYVKN